jgi:hypothetical protein
VATRRKEGGGAASRSNANLWIVLTLLAYTAVVHLLDTFGWHEPYLRPLLRAEPLRALEGSGFDVFKFVAWFLAPFLFLLVLRRIDWGYFGVTRWRRRDVIFLAALIVAGMLAVLSILVFPSLRQWYPSMEEAPAFAKWRFATHALVWTVSWIVGWEFIHRYALLTQLARVAPRFGWLLIPVIEGVYHLQKDPLEAGAMVVFSLVLTRWALVRRNVLLPFLAHLAVEIELLLFQVFA